jgi:hypothetical protein
VRLSLDALAPAARTWLPRLAAEPISDFYLAGSAALALHLGHRTVGHLDLMSAVGRLAPADRRDLLSWLLARDAGLKVETARDGYLLVRDRDGVELQFFWYPYPLIEPTEAAEGCEVASLLDLALMKLGAVISRATVRDLADLEHITRVLPLATVLERAPEKFGHVVDFPLQALKALADLEILGAGDDAETHRLRDWGRSAARELGRVHLGLDSAARS